MHFFGKSSDVESAANPVYAGQSQGYTQSSLIDHAVGSVHTGLSLNWLGAKGHIAPHVHSYEEGFYILEGKAEVMVNDRAWQLGPGDFGAIKVGTPHAWRNAGGREVRWLQMAAPQPKPHGAERDTYFPRDAKIPAAAGALDLQDLGGALLGHFDVSQIPPVAERPAGPVGPGVFLRWLVDEHFGARHHRILFLEYQPGATIGLHDHTFEEAYFILSGEVEAVLDGKHYLAQAGDVLWTGVGCVHSFKNTDSQPVRWLETFSPQPPDENAFRFMAEWEQKAKDWEGN